MLTTLHDMAFLYDEEVAEDRAIEGYQHLIDTGLAWKMEGHVGRTCMGLIEAGICMLGEVGYYDTYGSYVPSRTEVVPGTKGSPTYGGSDCPMCHTPISRCMC